MSTETYDWNLDQIRVFPEFESLTADDKIALIHAWDLKCRQSQGGHTGTVEYWKGKYFCAFDGGESAPELVSIDESLFSATYAEAINIFHDCCDESHTFYEALIDVGFPYSCDVFYS